MSQTVVPVDLVVACPVCGAEVTIPTDQRTSASVESSGDVRLSTSISGTADHDCASVVRPPDR
jgi:hypothetical protein